MGVFVDLEEEDLKVLLAAYEEQRKAKQEGLKKIMEEIKRLDDKIERVKKTGVKPTVPVAPIIVTPISQQELAGINKYDRGGKWNEKIKFVMLEHKKPMTTAEIVTAIISYEPELDRKKATTSVSATLTVAAQNGIYKKKVKEGEDHQYSLAN